MSLFHSLLTSETPVILTPVYGECGCFVICNDMGETIYSESMTYSGTIEGYKHHMTAEEDHHYLKIYNHGIGTNIDVGFHGHLEVYSGGVVNGCTASYEVDIKDGGTINNLTLNYGWCYCGSGSTLNGVTVESDASLTIDAGATVTGIVNHGGTIVYM